MYVYEREYDLQNLGRIQEIPLRIPVLVFIGFNV